MDRDYESNKVYDWSTEIDQSYFIEWENEMGNDEDLD